MVNKNPSLIEHVSSLKGVGDKSSALFEKCGIKTVEDLLSYFPRDYDICEEIKNVSDLASGEISAVRLTAVGNIAVKKVRNLSILTFKAGDVTGTLQITYFNMPFMRNNIKPGKYYVFRGLVQKKGNSFVMEQPKMFKTEDYLEIMGSMQPRYPLVKGLSNQLVIKTVKQAIPSTPYLEEMLPSYIRRQLGLMDYSEAVRKIHFPANMEEFSTARRRIAFNEILEFILRLRFLKRYEEQSINDYNYKSSAQSDSLIDRLPYKLTGKQLEIWADIKSDLTGKNVMNRLIQGDVGSGKTILAFLSLLFTAENGYQGAIMAPTEVLARQHYEGFIEMKERYNLPITPILLVGSLSVKEKRIAQEGIENGDYNLIIGTNALIQEKVNYNNLSLVITDEQHRFGVQQRERLSEKGKNVHILAMSATPIPRTLAIILYGDLHISILDEMPKGRIPIKNCVVGTEYRPTAYKFIADQVKKGHQAYVICPMIEEGETDGLENVSDYTEKLRDSMPSDIRIRTLHGKQKPSEKESIMEEFARGEIDILVSTTVIEVGINVPNATVMMIENSERFGLAQLHQLRGRVGRGKDQSYCIFINTSGREEAKQRLDIMNHSNDGFVIAEEDLKQRGPGDLFGIRQSGEMSFHVADIYQDAALIREAAALADRLLSEDPDLIMEENSPLKQWLISNSFDFTAL
ncbi:ATP-dependent DNA helicase RecG [Butyrivibrio sp. INlla16]|uniref:ATP-dependent DNA helicase RecG n=1 Tax=Butyrivibrio sp. INlla16 TaxID=1520807 RepID=UPI0008895661|nr:ATP-dependent DNA helicase RecG [Butyrivibrio sp. INlla16]SDB16603.1 ATP-dependent DNA helicase RecG [Butyrivibrio sp. INlla16]